MNVLTVSEVLHEHNKLNNWKEPILFADGTNIVDLSVCFGTSPTQPPKAKYQPSNYPHNTTYHIDKLKYNGEEALPMLVQDLQSACLGCTLHWKKTNVGSTQTYYQMKCDH